ncbi:Pullulanase secretion envelope pulD,putative outer membrane porin HofQ,Type II secretory pathway, component HofQ,type II secretion system protein D,Bacterial type II and III secretion system protein [Chlamydia serpentis]|uniref:Pullulanase secretion envelope pulD,putative outer membrane porin HofQ,Type II secretory pathway, component HofQ,type II secretion system protein D,Bacterial type II and III secretion system protein n=1 Tax=Chlamydia serpentis TaxID=1967782 RepID=A0A2R8FBK8_9CHLA|nr:type II secretion system protein GspD [Chlamydia serpentis]SPN73820.1 Pullulanase secretion envelope pulD,putative outer membrane porin HofQ,Type II secretory pathway, component HofQ,type II secretion system protein D,Bacterial type II and III secretion system protein [Chlamydia serpentis]
MKTVTLNIGRKVLQLIKKKKKKIGILSALFFLDLVLLGVSSQKSVDTSDSVKHNPRDQKKHLAACPKNSAASLAAKKYQSKKTTPGSIPSKVFSKLEPANTNFKKNAGSVLPAKPTTLRELEERKKSRIEYKSSTNIKKSPRFLPKQEEEPVPAVSQEELDNIQVWEDKQQYARRAINAVNLSIKKQLEEQVSSTNSEKEIKTTTKSTTNSSKQNISSPLQPSPMKEKTVVTPTVSQEKSEEEKVKERLSKREITCEDLKDNGYTVNFEDISILELLQFVSKISGTNFVFDSNDLQFNVTIVSHDPTSVDDLSTILLQVLKMHDLKVVEQGNNVLIYRNPHLSKLSTVVTDSSLKETCEAVVVTRVFRLYSVSPAAAVSIIQPLLSHDAIVSASEATRHIIISDIAGNVDKVSDLLAALDSPGAAIDMTEYEVKYANPAALVSYCQDVLGTMAEDEAFQMFIQPGTNKIFVVSSPRLANKAEQLLKSLDVPEMAHTLDDAVSTSLALGGTGTSNPKSLRFFMYKLKYQNGEVIANALQDIGYNLYVTTAMDEDFINTLNSIQWLEVNNSIVIIGNQGNVDRVVSLLNGLDLPPKQVYIEVLILDTSLEKSWDFGVQWVALGDEQSKVAYASGLLNNTGIVTPTKATVPPATPNPGSIPLPTPGQLTGFSDMLNSSSAFGLGIIGNVLSHKGKSFLTLGGLLSALDQDGDTIIVLNPRIMAQDTQQASFFVGQTVPYQTTNTIIQETGTVTQNIDYEDIGVNLVVTSTVAPNNVVTLQIEQTISELHSASGSLTPITDKTYAATRLQIPDGCFLVMSGHIRDKTTKVVSGVPLLNSIPLIRGLFSRTIDQRQKRNIMMFIKPKVISSFEEGTRVTNKEGYRYNWEADIGSMQVAPRNAPECQRAPSLQEDSDFKVLEIEAQ